MQNRFAMTTIPVLAALLLGLWAPLAASDRVVLRSRNDPGAAARDVVTYRSSEGSRTVQSGQRLDLTARREASQSVRSVGSSERVRSVGDSRRSFGERSLDARRSSVPTVESRTIDRDSLLGIRDSDARSRRSDVRQVVGERDSSIQSRSVDPRSARVRTTDRVRVLDSRDRYDERYRYDRDDDYNDWNPRREEAERLRRIDDRRDYYDRRDRDRDVVIIEHYPYDHDYRSRAYYRYNENHISDWHRYQDRWDYDYFYYDSCYPGSPIYRGEYHRTLSRITPGRYYSPHLYRDGYAYHYDRPGSRSYYRVYSCSPYRYRSYYSYPWYNSYHYSRSHYWSNAISYAPGFAWGFSFGSNGVSFGYGYGGAVRFGSSSHVYSWYPYGGYQRVRAWDNAPEPYTRYVAPALDDDKYDL